MYTLVLGADNAADQARVMQVCRFTNCLMFSSLIKVYFYIKYHNGYMFFLINIYFFA